MGGRAIYEGIHVAHTYVAEGVTFADLIMCICDVIVTVECV